MGISVAWEPVDLVSHIGSEVVADSKGSEVGASKVAEAVLLTKPLHTFQPHLQLCGGWALQTGCMQTKVYKF